MTVDELRGTVTGPVPLPGDDGFAEEVASFNNPLLSIEIRALGGALDREPEVPNAVPTRGVPYVMFGFGVSGPDQAERLRGWLERMVHTFEPWSVDQRRMVNFLSKDEATTPEQTRRVYGVQRYDRLARVKRRADPDNTFRVNHNIRPE